MPVDPARFRDLWRRMIPAADRGAVTFRRQTAPGVYTDTAVTDAWFRQGSVQEAEASNGAYLVEALSWFIPRELLPPQPVPGDQLTGAAAQKSAYPLTGKTWVVGKGGSKAVNAEGVWEIACVRPFVNPARAELIRIERPEPTITDGGAQLRGTATLLASNVLAAVQVSDTFAIAPVQAGINFDKYQTPNPVRIYIETVIRVQPKDRVIVQSTGQAFTILNDSNINRVGEFMAFDAILHQ